MGEGETTDNNTEKEIAYLTDEEINSFSSGLNKLFSTTVGRKVLNKLKHDNFVTRSSLLDNNNVIDETATPQYLAFCEGRRSLLLQIIELTKLKEEDNNE